MIKKMRAAYLAAFACLMVSLEAAKFLAIFPVPGRSHWMLEKPLLRALADKGHHVTVVTPYKSGGNLTNWEEIIIPEVQHLLGGSANLFNFSLQSAVISSFFLFRYGINACDALLATDGVLDLYKSDQKFDVVIAESFFQDCFFVFAHKFKAHLIHIAPYEGNHWMADTVGNPNPFAYVPDPFLRYTDHMSFFERLHNAAFGTFQRLLRQYYFLPTLDAIVQKHFKDPTIPAIADIERRASLLLTHTHVSLGHPRPSVPNRIDIGGLHIQKPKKLPEDLQNYLDKSKEGVIYFSLGSNLNSSDMPEEKRAAFLTVFSKLKQNVIWKWETEKLPNQSPNIMIRKWLPQSDILAHKNIKLFITHGGLLSTMEAVDRGVPLLAIPVYGDQMLNAIRAVNSGYAKRIDFPFVTVESLQSTISQLLTNTSYKERAQTLSNIFHDRPRPPLEEAIFWTEYVVRHNGAHHMRSAALDLTWWQYLLLDVLAAVMAAAVILCTVSFFTIRLLWRLVFGKNKTAKKSKKGAKKD